MKNQKHRKCQTLVGTLVCTQKVLPKAIPYRPIFILLSIFFLPRESEEVLPHGLEIVYLICAEYYLGRLGQLYRGNEVLDV